MRRRFPTVCSQAVNELLHANLVEEISCVPDIVNPVQFPA